MKEEWVILIWLFSYVTLEGISNLIKTETVDLVLHVKRRKNDQLAQLDLMKVEFILSVLQIISNSLGALDKKRFKKA